MIHGLLLQLFLLRPHRIKYEPPSGSGGLRDARLIGTSWQFLA